MSAPGSATFLTLLAVISLHELLLLAAPAIENAAYISQDLWPDEAAPATWAAPLRRQRRYDEDYSGERVHCGRQHSHRGGPDHWPGHSRGYSQGPPNFPHWHPYPQPPLPFGFGFGPYGPGYKQPVEQYKTPLAPFQDNQQGFSEPKLSSGNIAPPSAKPTKVPATTSTPSTTSTTEDTTLNIDIRSGLS